MLRSRARARSLPLILIATLLLAVMGLLASCGEEPGPLGPSSVEAPGLALRSTTGTPDLEVCYGPERFTPTWHDGGNARRRPEPECRSIGGPWIHSFMPPFIIHIVNGDPDGGHRASSAIVELDGEMIAGPADFNQNVAALEREITLTEESVLSVLVKSAKDSHIDIWIEGVPVPVEGPLLVRRWNLATGRNWLLRMDLDGVVTETLMETSGDTLNYPALDPETDLLAFSVGSPLQVHVLDLGDPGAVPMRITPPSGSHSGASELLWHDGWIYFVSHPQNGTSEVWRVRPDGSLLEQMTNWRAQGKQVSEFDFGPDFVVQKVQNASWAFSGRIVRADLDFRNPVWLDADDGLTEGRPAASPDGTRIAWMKEMTPWSGRWNIWLMNADGSDPHALTGPGFRSPRWSPDGTRLAIDEVSPERETDVWIVNADGSDLHPVTDTPDLQEWVVSWF